MPRDLRNYYSGIAKSVEALERSTAAEGASQPPSSKAFNTNWPDRVGKHLGKGIQFFNLEDKQQKQQIIEHKP